MNIDISAVDAWLFDIAQEFDVPVCCLVSPDIDDLFNKKLPRVEREQIASLLYRQIVHGNLRITNIEPGVEISEKCIKDMLLDLPIEDRRSSPYYGTTPKGRLLWKNYQQHK